MVQKNREFENTRVLLDAGELVGLSQVASVSPAEAELSLSDLGRLLSKKGGGEMPAPVKENK